MTEKRNLNGVRREVLQGLFQRISGQTNRVEWPMIDILVIA